MGPETRGLSLEVDYEDRWHRYRVLLGPSLQGRLAELMTTFYGRSTTGDPLELIYSGGQAACDIQRGFVLAEVELTVVANRGGERSEPVVLKGQGKASLENLFSFQVEAQVRAAFDLALRRIEAQQLIFLRDTTREAPPKGEKVVVPSAAPVAASDQELDLEQVEELVRLGDNLAAEEALSTLIGRHPVRGLLFQRRASVRLSLGREDAALADAYRAVELDPQSAAAYLTRAMIRERRGETKLALADVEAALARPHSDSISSHANRLRLRLERP